VAQPFEGELFSSEGPGPLFNPPPPEKTQSEREDAKPSPEPPATDASSASSAASATSGFAAKKEESETPDASTADSAVADSSLTYTWSFATSDASNYSLSSSYVELSGGLVRLKPTSHSVSLFSGGTHAGTIWDGTVLRLDAATSTNASALDESWAPHWANLQWYWNMDGSGSVPTTDFLVTKGGTNCIAYTLGSSYVAARMSQGIQPLAGGWDLYCRGTNISGISDIRTHKLSAKRPSICARGGNLCAWKACWNLK